MFAISFPEDILKSEFCEQGEEAQPVESFKKSNLARVNCKAISSFNIASPPSCDVQAQKNYNKEKSKTMSKEVEKHKRKKLKKRWSKN